MSLSDVPRKRFMEINLEEEDVIVSEEEHAEEVVDELLEEAVLKEEEESGILNHGGDHEEAGAVGDEATEGMTLILILSVLSFNRVVVCRMPRLNVNEPFRL